MLDTTCQVAKSPFANLSLLFRWMWCDGVPGSSNPSKGCMHFKSCSTISTVYSSEKYCFGLWVLLQRTMRQLYERYLYILHVSTAEWKAIHSITMTNDYYDEWLLGVHLYPFFKYKYFILRQIRSRFTYNATATSLSRLDICIPTGQDWRASSDSGTPLHASSNESYQLELSTFMCVTAWPNLAAGKAAFIEIDQLGAYSVVSLPPRK